MLANLGLALLAGVVTLLNPCVLPLLPIVVASAFASGRRGPLALGVGLALSFAVFGTLLASVGFALGLDQALLRQVAALLLLACGVVLLVPAAQTRFATAMGPIVSGAGNLQGRISGEGTGGQFLLGVVLGALWSPCVGPTLGAAVAAASQGRNLAEAGLTMLAFGLGAGASLCAFAYGSRQALAHRRKSWGQVAAVAKPLMGGLFVLVGALVLSGLDKRLEARVLDGMPLWLIDLTTRL